MIVGFTQKQVCELLESNISDEIKKVLNKKLLKEEKRKARKQRKREERIAGPSLARRAEAERFRNDLIRKQTESEKVFKAILKSLKIKYDFQKIFFINSNAFYIADFYIPSKNIVFEIDGGYHFNKTQGIKDAKRTKKLKYKGVNAVHRFMNNRVLEDHIYTSNRIKEIMKLK